MAEQFDSPAARAVRNGYDPDLVKKTIDAVERAQAEIDGIMEVAKAECQEFRDEIKEIKSEASVQGLPKKALNAIIRRARLLKNTEHIPDKLCKEERDDYDQLLHCLGDLRDTPLGAAALETPSRQREGSDPEPTMPDGAA